MAKPNKHERIQILIEALRDGGEMAKSEIDRVVSTRLGIDKIDLKRALYRDLEDLVFSGRVLSRHFTAAGAEIQTAELPKNFSTKWRLPESAASFTGSDYLLKYGARASIAERLKSSVSITKGYVDSPTDYSVVLSISSQVFAIKIKKDSIPFTLIVTRRQNGTLTDEDIKKILERPGQQRTMFLELPIDLLSAAGKSNRIGHCQIKIESNGQILITDLGSKNGTSCGIIEAHTKTLFEPFNQTRTKGAKNSTVLNIQHAAPNINYKYQKPIWIGVEDVTICAIAG